MNVIVVAVSLMIDDANFNSARERIKRKHLSATAFGSVPSLTDPRDKDVVMSANSSNMKEMLKKRDVMKLIHSLLNSNMFLTAYGSHVEGDGDLETLRELRPHCQDHLEND